jgi:hypothetical protein
VSKQEIDVSLTRRVKVVLIGALVAACRGQQELPADRTLQDGGHMLFLFKLTKFARMFEIILQKEECKMQKLK